MQYDVCIFFKRSNVEKLSDIFISEWNAEAGADEIIAEKPADLYSVAPALLSSANKEKTCAATKQTPYSSEEKPAVSDNLFHDNSLSHITSLDELRLAMQSFTGCALKTTAMNTVFSDGCPQADIMIVGEAPGADEDRMGKAFVGRSGQLLDKMLASIGLSRKTNVYISNIIPWRPPGNRTPSTAEVAACLPFIRKHIELINPALLLLLGKSSASALLNTVESISHLRGRVFDYKTDSGKIIPALVTFHPAFLLREPLQKRLAWQDMLKLQKTLKELNIL